MGNPITTPAPSATPATTALHNLLAEFQPAAPLAPVSTPSAPTGNSDIPGLPAVGAGEKTLAPVGAPVPAQGASPPALEFDLTALGIAEDPQGEITEAIDPTTSRGKQIWADHKFMRALELPPDQGGIGYRPTLEQISAMAKDAQALANLVLDLQSGEKPHNIAAMNYLLRLAPQAFLDLSKNLPPDMLKLARDRVLEDEIQNLLGVARKFPDTDDQNKTYRRFWFGVANGLYFTLTNGQSLDPQVLLQAPPARETESDRLQAREQELAKREQAIARQRFEGWKAEVTTRRETAIREMVAQVVKPVQASESVKALATDAIVSRTLEQLRNQSALMDQVTILLRRAEANLGNDEALKSGADQIVELYIRGASPIIRRQVAESIKNTASSVAGAAAADAAKARQASSGDPTPAGSPSAPGGAPQAGQTDGKLRPREKGETDQKYIQSVLANVLRN